MTPSAAPERHAEWKRFLGGIPYSHARGLEPEERQALRREALRYEWVSLASVVLAGVVATAVYADFPIFAFVIALVPVVVIGYCLAWVRPFWQTLRSRQIHLYVGHPSALPEFDEIQNFYRGNLGLEKGLNQRIEILAIGNGDRAWRLNDVPNDERLAGIRPIAVALLPNDLDPNRRTLTPEEVTELRNRAREVGRFGAHAVYVLVGACVAVALFPDRLGFAGPMATPLAFILWIVFNLPLAVPLYRRQLTRRLLLQDAEAGTVEDGRLSSGLLWIRRGWPARWRTGHPGEMSEGISVLGADVLEILSRSKAIAKENAAGKRA